MIYEYISLTGGSKCHSLLNLMKLLAPATNLQERREESVNLYQGDAINYTQTVEKSSELIIRFLNKHIVRKTKEK